MNHSLNFNGARAKRQLLTPNLVNIDFATTDQAAVYP